MKTKKEFTFATPIFFKDKKLADATISGKGWYDWAEHGYYDYCYADVDVSGVVLTIGEITQDFTLAYIVDKGLMGSFCDAIDKAIHAHMEYLFEPKLLSTNLVNE